MRSKILALAFAAALAAALGLTACGSQQGGSPASSADTSAPAATSAPATSSEVVEAVANAVIDEILYWEGTLPDGQVVTNMYDETGEYGALIIVKPDGSDAEAFIGKVTSPEEKKLTITDEVTKNAITYTVVDLAEDLSGINIDIEGYGAVEMKPVTESEFVEAIEKNIVGETLYWEGTLPDGQVVTNMYDRTGDNAALSIIEPDGSDAKFYIGRVTSDGFKVTITDGATNEKITFTVVDMADDDSALKIDIEGYGEVEMTPVTEADFLEAIGDLALSSIVYWEGTLPDGRIVDNMFDMTGDNAILSITTPDGSDMKYYSGRVTIVGDRVTITDDETKQIITFTISSISGDGNTYKINIDGFGEVELQPITADDFLAATEMK